MRPRGRHIASSKSLRTVSVISSPTWLLIVYKFSGGPSLFPLSENNIDKIGAKVNPSHQGLDSREYGGHVLKYKFLVQYPKLWQIKKGSRTTLLAESFNE